VAPYHDVMGSFASVLAHSRAGIAAKYKLDIPTARREFREAFEIGARVGSHSHAARLSGALHGELLYEAGELDEAARRLRMIYGLGPRRRSGNRRTRQSGAPIDGLVMSALVTETIGERSPSRVIPRRPTRVVAALTK